MKILPISVNNNETKRNNPNFGMKFVSNKAAKELIEIMHSNGYPKKDMVALIKTLDEQFDDTITLAVNKLEPVYKYEEKEAWAHKLKLTVTNGLFTETAKLFIPKEYYLLNNSMIKFLETIQRLADNVGVVKKSGKEVLEDVVDKIYNK